MQIVINTLSQLQALKTTRGRRGVRRVSLRLPGYPGDLRRAEYHINRNLHASSFKWIATFGLVAFLLFALVIGLAPGLPLARRELLMLMGSLVGGAMVAGWIFARALANWRLQRAIDWCSERCATFSQPVVDPPRVRGEARREPPGPLPSGPAPHPKDATAAAEAPDGKQHDPAP
jgi:hypothetical protein